MDAARPLDEWHEDDGPVVWWRFPVEEPAWIGTPLDDDWIDGYYTHWTPHPPIPVVTMRVTIGTSCPHCGHRHPPDGICV